MYTCIIIIYISLNPLLLEYCSHNTIVALSRHALFVSVHFMMIIKPILIRIAAEAY